MVGFGPRFCETFLLALYSKQPRQQGLGFKKCHQTLLAHIKYIHSLLKTPVAVADYICGPERMLGPSIYTAAVAIGGSDCPYDLLAEWLNALMQSPRTPQVDRTR